MTPVTIQTWSTALASARIGLKLTAIIASPFPRWCIVGKFHIDKGEHIEKERWGYILSLPTTKRFPDVVSCRSTPSSTLEALCCRKLTLEVLYTSCFRSERGWCMSTEGRDRERRECVGQWMRSTRWKSPRGKDLRRRVVSARPMRSMSRPLFVK